MRKNLLFPLCCCLGAALSSLLPCGVLWWGQTLTQRPFALPEITYAAPERPADGETAADMEQILTLLEKGTRKPVTTMETDTVEMDASALLSDLQEEVEELQARGILSPKKVYYTQSAVLARWSMPEGRQTDLWEFTLAAEGETVLLRYHLDPGRVLSVQRTRTEAAPPFAPDTARKDWGDYLSDHSLPGLPQVWLEQNTIFLSISPP